MKTRWIGLWAALLLPACGDGSSGGGATRPFQMGFTPWLYDATNEARDWTFEAVGRAVNKTATQLC